MRRLFARLVDLGGCDRGAVTVDFVILLGSVVVMVLAVFSSLAPGGGMNAAVMTLVSGIVDEMATVIP